ncbi:MAG: bifunctional methylenetetrahydrofolate dehydrogenase/methenyltetrahydrofolate cyclohydrolase FolD [Kiritimatiellae bacterium]|nr:bifunctional methylenetetrahydrofolate dehydrogenase/methenyltetrahydrofolate cyclohydrolase FolD [Kiritimatiellia bacterium]
MPAQIIDGKQIAKAMREEIREEALRLTAAGHQPGLGVVLVGEDPASQSYVSAKEKACEEAGLYSDDNRLPADVSEADLIAVVERLNADERIHGILVQLPLPAHINEGRILLAIDPDKDVDGFHPMNVGKMLIGEKAFIPCTPHGVVQLLVRSGITIAGSHVVVVGRSNIVGKPVAALLARKHEHGNATVTLCHTGTKDIGSFTRQADIVIVAAGRPNTLTADMIREGAVVIDVGVNRVTDETRKRGYRLAGDVDYEPILEKASFVTPVPGGVGPMTITMLLFNTLESARMRAESHA